MSYYTTSQTTRRRTEAFASWNMKTTRRRLRLAADSWVERSRCGETWWRWNGPTRLRTQTQKSWLRWAQRFNEAAMLISPTYRRWLEPMEKKNNTKSLIIFFPFSNKLKFKNSHFSYNFQYLDFFSLNSFIKFFLLELNFLSSRNSCFFSWIFLLDIFLKLKFWL